jgi:hypothetical protein
MHTRYCPDCDDEFRPDIQRCSDCGGELEDRYDEEGEGGTREAEASEPNADAPPEEYRPVFGCMQAASLKEAAGALAAAGIPFRATGCSTGFQLLVREADQSVAAAALKEREGVLRVPDDSGPSIGAEGGPCPACGASVPGAMLECPECGLVVGGE